MLEQSVLTIEIAQVPIMECGLAKSLRRARTRMHNRRWITRDEIADIWDQLSEITGEERFRKTAKDVRSIEKIGGAFGPTLMVSV
ncbi:MAG: pyruvate kinase 1 [Phage AS32]|nr:MAG: pyruvate kinase 1 [Phage AS32]